MKRSAALQPLSREHHTALTMAKACEQAALSGDDALVNRVCRRVVRSYSSELARHFQNEEDALLPKLRGTDAFALIERTLADHQQLREKFEVLKQNDAETLGSFGRCLAAHVRFEERELFPVLEKLL